MAKISGIKENSIAEELEIVEGDELISIDGIELKDSIDYNFYTKAEELTILIKKQNGEYEEIELEKDFDEDYLEFIGEILADVCFSSNNKSRIKS